MKYLENIKRISHATSITPLLKLSVLRNFLPMKKTLTSIFIGLTCLSVSSLSYAEDLVSIYEQAKANDPVVLKAQALYRASEEDIEIARSVLLPQIAAYGAYTDTSTDTYVPSTEFTQSISGNVDTERKSYGASLSMELYHHDSWLNLSNAKKSAHRSDLTYQLAKQDLILRVTEAYFNVLSAIDDLGFATAEKKAIERQLEQTKQRFSVGLTAITDVHEAQAQYDESVTEEIRAQNSVYSAEEALRVVTNVYPKNLNPLNTKRFSTSTPIPNSADEWQKLAEVKNLGLIAEKVTVDIAKENINIATAGHYPTLDLSGSYTNSKDTVNSDNFPKYHEPDLDSHSIGVTLTVPIYTGGATSSSVRQAQSYYVAASQDLQGTHREVIRNTRNAYNTVRATISGIKALEQSVISAESALKATEAGFEVGTRTIVDVLDSTRNLYDARRNLSNTRYRYIVSVLFLKKSGGTITEADLESINLGLVQN